MPRKSPTFGQLLGYITQPETAAPAITHNLAAGADDLAAIHREFLENFRYLPARKNGNVLYHEILSCSDQDRPNVTHSILEDLTRRYLDLRAPFALAYAQVHLETECPHVHIMISANNRESHRRLSLTRKRFAKVKRDLEQYQKLHYPFMKHSIVFDPGAPKKRGRQSRNESERDRRLIKKGLVSREPSRKEQIRNLVAEQFATARSAKGFTMRLKVLGLELYQHGKQFGVQDLAGDSEASLSGRRYRLKTLGLQDTLNAALERWNVSPKELLAQEVPDLERAQHLWRQRGFRDQIRDVMALYSSELSPLERERLERIHSLRAWRQDKGRDLPEQPEQSL